MEGRVLDMARRTLDDRRSRSMEADLCGQIDDVRDGVCGGRMTVWVVRLEGASALNLIEEVERNLQIGKRVTLATRKEGLALVDHSLATGLYDEKRQYPNVLIKLDRIPKALLGVLHATGDARIAGQVERDHGNLGVYRSCPQFISKAGGLTPPVGMNKARGFIAELITVAGKNRDKVRRVRRKVCFTRFADR